MGRSPRAVAVSIETRNPTEHVAQSYLVVVLDDKRIVMTPLDWYPRLLAASRSALANYQLIGDGEGIHWPDLDEDLSIAGILVGHRAPRCMSRWRRGLVEHVDAPPDGARCVLPPHDASIEHKWKR